MKNKILTVTALTLFTLSIFSCRDKTPAEKAGDAVENSVEEVGDAFEDTGDEIEDAVEDTGDEIEDATE